jgi:hypothetical protein
MEFGATNWWFYPIKCGEAEICWVKNPVVSSIFRLQLISNLNLWPSEKILISSRSVSVSAFYIPVVFYIFVADRKLHAYILLCIFCERIFLTVLCPISWPVHNAVRVTSAFIFLSSRKIFLATKRDTAFLQTWPVYVYILKPEKCSFRKLKIIGILYFGFLQTNFSLVQGNPWYFFLEILNC